MRINPVHVRKRPPADVMIDADQKMVLQSFQPSSMDAIAFENNGSLVTSRDAIGLHNLVRERKRAINAGNTIVKNDVCLLAQAAQDLATGERGSHRIAIRAGVRGQHEPLVLSDVTQHIFEHVATPSPHRLPCALYFVFWPAATNLPPELWPVRRDPTGSTTPAHA